MDCLLKFICETSSTFFRCIGQFGIVSGVVKYGARESYDVASGYMPAVVGS